MQKEQARSLARRAAKAIAAKVADTNTAALGITWNNMSSDAKERVIGWWTDIVRKLFEQELPEDPADMVLLIRELASRRGSWTGLTCLVLDLWAEDDPKGVATMGASEDCLVPCGCDSPGPCVWCADTRKVTHRVKIAKDEATLAVEAEESEPESDDLSDAEQDAAAAWTGTLLFLEKARELGISKLEHSSTSTGTVKAEFWTPEQLDVLNRKPKKGD
ncbi:MAG: hypothetical protein KAJ19_20755 [Gammaproteobacteria bacterium]|nr:hypothetical protein [Gammaproteobacteria bacterium]